MFPAFPPLSTVHATFTVHGAPSNLEIVRFNITYTLRYSIKRFAMRLQAYLPVFAVYSVFPVVFCSVGVPLGTSVLFLPR